MADSFRSDPSHAAHDASDAGRDAKIEQLLLAGLDHYFASRYEHAINVWTRALFFDRSHARARAYIDRARSALAERQRQSEELLERGGAALDRGHGHEARRLLQAAVDNGARADETHPLLDRLNREGGGVPTPVDLAQARPSGRSKRAVASRTPTRSSALPRAVSRLWFGVLLTIALLCLVAVAGYTIATREGMDLRSLFTNSDVPAASALSPASRDARPPLPRRGEMALGRARALALRGMLHEAITTLDLVRASDPERPEADRVRAEIQRQLLGLVSLAPPLAPPSAAAPSDRGAGRQP